jgi:hypothetical protein
MLPAYQERVAAFGNTRFTSCPDARHGSGGLAGIPQRWWFSAIHPRLGNGVKWLSVNYLKFGLERAFAEPRRVSGDIGAAVTEVEE